MKKQKPLKPSLIVLRNELRKQLLSDPDGVEARLDELALTDRKAALRIADDIGFFDTDGDTVDLGNGIFCTANAIIPE